MNTTAGAVTTTVTVTATATSVALDNSNHNAAVGAGVGVPLGVLLVLVSALLWIQTLTTYRSAGDDTVKGFNIAVSISAVDDLKLFSPNPFRTLLNVYLAYARSMIIKVNN